MENLKDKLGVPIEGFAEFSRKVASEGCVLLKNQNNCLPIKSNEKISIFGRCQIEYYRSGTGSGGAVNTLYNTNILDSLNELAPNSVNNNLADLYKDFIKENPFDNGNGWATEPWCQKEMLLTTEIVENAKKHSDKAIIVVGRTAGEDKDNLNVEGSYLLTKDELEMIKLVTKTFSDVCLLLNISNIINLSFLDDFNIDAVLCSWNGGMEGGRAACDILLGNINPSGKLPDTIAYDIDDYYSTKNHNGVEKNVYEEDIYVGYRYFETFASQKVQFPFGFGLSYTSFEIKNTLFKRIGSIENNDKYGIELSIKVTNIGSVKGKEVVQVYMEAPQGKLGKPSRSLVGFSKTAEINPNEYDELTIFIPYKRLVSYDDIGVTGHKSSYVLENGTYNFYIGNSVRATEKVSFEIPDLIILEELSECLAPIESFNRIKPVLKNGVFEIETESVPKRTISLKERIKSNLPKELSRTSDKFITLTDVKDKNADIDDFVAQLTVSELTTIVRGEGMGHPQVTPGVASAFGGVTEDLRKYKIPLISCADGPSGIRMETGLKSTQVPIGTMLASTWDTEIIEELYTFTGKELVQNYVDVLLGPGMNIHRNPLCGRNFEYFSEDPLLTGLMASSVVKGISKSGATATLKHFACNSQEKYRHTIDSVLSERAIREIYLKGFEIAVKEGRAVSIMTAYNPVNGHYTASNYDLNTTILRGEWNFKGFVMTDWWARLNDVFDGGKGNRYDISSMVKSQNDVYMIVGNFEAGEIHHSNNTAKCLDENILSIAELQRCAKNICNFAINSTAMNRDFELFGATKLIKSAKKSSIENSENTNVKIELANKNDFSFNCTQDGLYKFSAEYSSTIPDLAQYFFNFMINDNTVTTLQINTTNDQVLTKTIGFFRLEVGEYTAKFDVSTDQIKLFNFSMTLVD